MSLVIDTKQLGQVLLFAVMHLAIVFVLCESAIGKLYRLAMLALTQWWPALNAWVFGLIYCPLCTGFWIGFGLYLTGHGAFLRHAPAPAFAAGCLGIVLGNLALRFFPMGNAHVTDHQQHSESSDDSPSQS